MTDPVELARNVRTVSEREWVNVPQGIVFITCGECGYSHSLEVANDPPGEHMIRIAADQDVTDACREHKKYPIYGELLYRREQCAQQGHQIKELEALLATRNHQNAIAFEENDKFKKQIDALLRLVQTMGKLDCATEELMKEAGLDPDKRFRFFGEEG